MAKTGHSLEERKAKLAKKIGDDTKLQKAQDLAENDEEFVRYAFYCIPRSRPELKLNKWEEKAYNAIRTESGQKTADNWKIKELKRKGDKRKTKAKALKE